ncbi:hypothetical protein Syun_030166 [Stephania yunnanensis]|uniref:Acetylajmalan esterase-like n=1 Tax=Stephania yunnanensis TaxID=152371 RepID=A0AAP0EAB8_9MAGN
MASYVSYLIVLLLLIMSPTGHNAHRLPPHHPCAFNAIYQLGDSISDTGNLVRESPLGAYLPFNRLPYGESMLLRDPTGRCSNGLLMIDFLAKALGLPLLNPYLNKEASFRHGVNFAVAGSTALNASFLAENKIYSPVTNSSLPVQLDWFSNHLKSMCFSKFECELILKKALFMVGEVGGNDYNYAFFQRKSMDELKALVPHVVQSIKNASERVIDLGARHLVVPGNFPIGCLPIYLTAFKTNDSSAYDDNKCLKGLNEFALFHNNQLQSMLAQLRREHPNVVILYADYYNALQWVLSHASSLGFEEESVMKACCGTGGDYNFDVTKMCATEGVGACPNPDLRVSWDGIHLTQKAYQYMTEWLVRHLRLQSRCRFI